VSETVAEAIFFFFIVVFGTTGEIFMSRAMKETGEVKSFRPAALVAVILRALRVKWMWFGVGMMAIGFFSLLAAFSFENVSFVVPVTALGYVVGAIGGKFFLGERVSLQRWIGILLVCAGVTLVLMGRR
jgi:drug/metabolite transporter (DMT)-like permease